MTTDNTNPAIPAEHMMSAQQDIRSRKALGQYLMRVNTIDVDGIFKRQQISGRKHVACIYRDYGIVLSPDQGSIAAINGQLNPQPNAEDRIKIIWPNSNRLIYRADGFSMRSLHFRYVEQPDRSIRVPYTETEEEKAWQAKANDNFYFGGSEERRRDALAAAVNYLSASTSLCDMDELRAYLREVPTIYVSGDYQGSPYHLERVKIDITDKCIWLDDKDGRMIQLPLPTASGIHFEETGFSTGAFKFRYTIPPTQVSTVAAVIRARRVRR